MTLWIDADSCPSAVRTALQKASITFSTNLVFVANHDIPFDSDNSLFKMIICQKTKGSADDYIVNNIHIQDIAVTRDIPLAKRLIDKDICVINDRGLEFTKKNIDRMLKDRELNIQLSAIGINMGKKTNHYGQKELAAFCTCLNNLLSKKHC